MNILAKIILFLSIIFSPKTIPQIVNNIIQPTPFNSLQISYMRDQNYPGSDLKIEETQREGSNYHQYIASYYSGGLKIYGLLTVPNSIPPKGGFPAIIFNHGYITPSLYKTTERYVAYVDAFARNGYVVFKSDYRGNGNSEGQPGSSYYSPNYTIDVLNALASVKKYKDVNPNKIGIWGHSMGGALTLRSIVVDTKDFRAAVIWSGVVGTYDDLINNWQNRVTYQPDAQDLILRNNNRQNFINQYGTPQNNPDFWHSIDPNYYLRDITIPVQIHVGTGDEEVPWDFSEGLYTRLKNLNKTVEFYTYQGADHNISQGFDLAMQRSVDFFDKYLKP